MHCTSEAVLQVDGLVICSCSLKAVHRPQVKTCVGAHPGGAGEMQALLPVVATLLKFSPSETQRCHDFAVKWETAAGDLPLFLPPREAHCPRHWPRCLHPFSFTYPTEALYSFPAILQGF